jgi:hypothetical protein
LQVAGISLCSQFDRALDPFAEIAARFVKIPEAVVVELHGGNDRRLGVGVAGLRMRAFQPAEGSSILGMIMVVFHFFHDLGHRPGGRRGVFFGGHRLALERIQPRALPPKRVSRIFRGSRAASAIILSTSVIALLDIDGNMDLGRPCAPAGSNSLARKFAMSGTGRRCFSAAARDLKFKRH